MQWRPEQKNRRTLNRLLFLSGGIGAAGYLAGQLATRLVWVFQLICVAGVVCMLYFWLRYSVTWFVYAIRTKSDDHLPGIGFAEEGGFPLHITHLPVEMLDFSVVKGQGQRNGAMECLLGLECLEEAVVVHSRPTKTEPDVRSIRERYGDMLLYDYTITLFWEEALLLVFRDGERYTGILIEPGEDMSSFLRGIPRRDQPGDIR